MSFLYEFELGHSAAYRNIGLAFDEEILSVSKIQVWERVSKLKFILNKDKSKTEVEEELNVSRAIVFRVRLVKWKKLEKEDQKFASPFLNSNGCMPINSLKQSIITVEKKLGWL